jgi:hypothetical protein
MEVYVYPQRKEADRIWACLDYVFETNTAEPRRLKGKKILSELQQKAAVYQSMRGMRAPTVMEKHIGQREPRVANSKVGTIISTNREETSGISGLHSSPQESQPSAMNSPILYGPGDVQLKGVPGPSIGRVPLIPDIQFAGVSNGESLWALPSSQSPEASSDTVSLSGQPVVAPLAPAADDPMADIDWVRTLCCRQRIC